MSLDINKFNNYNVFLDMAVDTTKSQNVYAIRLDPNSTPIKSIKAHINDAGFSIKTSLLGDSGETWSLVLTEKTVDSSSLDSNNIMFIANSPQLDGFKNVSFEFDDEQDSGEVDALTVAEFLEMELFLHNTDNHESVLFKNYVKDYGDSVCQQHPDLAVFYDSSYYYDEDAQEFVAGISSTYNTLSYTPGSIVFDSDSSV